jgi:hypothetical protein
VEFVYAQTFVPARDALAGRVALCFLLDIYGTDPQVNDPRVLPREELGAALGPESGLNELYQGLDQAGDEAGNLYLRRVYGQVERWQRAFLLAAERLGQGRGYGLHNLAEARRCYPWAAALGYSRKALYADAVALSLAGCDRLLQKPQGAGDAAIAQATRQAGPGLWLACRQAVDRRLGVWLAGRMGQGGEAFPAGLAALAALLGPRRGTDSLAALDPEAWPSIWRDDPRAWDVLQAMADWFKLTL